MGPTQYAQLVVAVAVVEISERLPTLEGEGGRRGPSPCCICCNLPVTHGRRRGQAWTVDIVLVESSPDLLAVEGRPAALFCAPLHCRERPLKPAVHALHIRTSYAAKRAQRPVTVALSFQQSVALSFQQSVALSFQQSVASVANTTGSDLLCNQAIEGDCRGPEAAGGCRPRWRGSGGVAHQ